jgi:hypothetical protein
MQDKTLNLAVVAACYQVGLLAISLLLTSDRPMKLGSFVGKISREQSRESDEPSGVRSIR